MAIALGVKASTLLFRNVLL